MEINSIKGNLSFLKYQCILEFTVFFLEFFFLHKVMVSFCLKHVFILLLAVRFLTDNALNSS